MPEPTLPTDPTGDTVPADGGAKAWLPGLTLVSCWLISPLSGLVLAAAFPPFNQGWLCWWALVPPLLVLRYGPDAIRRRPLRVGYLFGLGYFGGSVWWIGIVTTFGAACLILYLALYPAAWFALLHRWCWQMGRSEPGQTRETTTDTGSTDGTPSDAESSNSGTEPTADRREPLRPFGVGSQWSDRATLSAGASQCRGETDTPGTSPLRAPRFTTAGGLLFAACGACLWLATDFWRGVLILGGFDWNSPGIALHQNIPLLQLASLGGVSLLTWLVVFTNLALFRTIERQIESVLRRTARPPLWEAGLALLLVAGAGAWGISIIRSSTPAGFPTEKPVQTLRYASIQPNIQHDPWDDATVQQRRDVLARLRVMSEIALGTAPQLLIWPEDTGGFFLNRDQSLRVLVGTVLLDGREALRQRERQPHETDFALLLGSNLVDDGRLLRNAAIFNTLHHPRSQVYRKLRLVPFGEVLPLGGAMPWLYQFVPFANNFTPGERAVVFHWPARRAGDDESDWATREADDAASKLGGINRTDLPRLMPLICFEDTLGRDVWRMVASTRQDSTGPPDILVNLTNDGWFQNSPGAEQHLANAVARAVEHRVPLLRCANTGVTCLVTPLGVVRAAVQSADDPAQRVGVDGFLAGEVTWARSDELTPYQKYGDWVVLLSALVGVGCASGRLAGRRQRPTAQPE